MAGDAYFTLSCTSNHEEIEKRIKEIYNDGDSNKSFPFIDWDSIKWHSIINDVILVSKEFPDVLITIDKQMNDIDLFECPFSKYNFKNGKYYIQKSIIVWDIFDENKLS